MKPEREYDLVDILDRLLNKGIILNADLIISVAGVPLLGVNLKAALASIETMLDYGMMEAWDKSTREWYANEITNSPVPLLESENIIHRTFGSIRYNQGIIDTWKPGIWYLTDRRLFLWRKEPAEMLFETPLEGIEALALTTETHFERERNVIVLQIEHGERSRIHVSNVAGFIEALEKAAPKKLKKDIPACEVLAT